MERAGFNGIRRRIPLLVQKLTQKLQLLRCFPSIHSEFVQTLTPESLENQQGYLESYGQTLLLGPDVEVDPGELERKWKERGEVGERDIYGEGVLHYAVRREQGEEVQRLLKAGADPNLRNCLLRTPLHQAVIQNLPEITSELLTYGADPNLGDVEGWTALHFAVHLGHIPCLAALLPFQPDFQTVNSAGKTVLEYVKSEKIVKMIVEFEEWKGEDSQETADVSHEMPPTHTSFAGWKQDWGLQGRQARSSSENEHELWVKRTQD